MKSLFKSSVMINVEKIINRTYQSWICEIYSDFCVGCRGYGKMLEFSFNFFLPMFSGMLIIVPAWKLKSEDVKDQQVVIQMIDT